MKRKKRILFVVEAMGGGVFTYIVELANRLSESYEMFVAYAVRPQTPLDYKAFFREDVTLIEVKNFQRSVSALKDIKAFFEIRRIKKEIAPDIIHFHSSKAGAIGRVAFWGSKEKLFYTPHGYSFLMQNQGKYKVMLYRLVECILAKGNCKTISCSRGEFEESLRFSKNAEYVSNGIDINEIDRILSDISKCRKQTFTVYTVGRICKQKNPALFNEIAKQLPEINFLWIGDGELKNELTAPNITITGWLERAAVIRCAESADVFLLCSLWEGLPISLLEAMYMKKVCIVSNVLGNRDVIRDGISGYVCEQTEIFARRICEAKEKLPKKIIDNAYEAVKEIYNVQQMGEKYSAIYECECDRKYL